MPRHGPGLGAGSFPAANKLLMRYESDRAYKMHMQKINNVKHRLDVAEPKKRNHLVLRLKQIQKEEERQAEIDHENKLLLNKMTHVLKYGGNIDNWNNYESRSLNFPFRERQNEEIARENLGIARRLETVRPKVEIDKYERQYQQQHQYLKRLWSDSVKDFGEFTPRRLSRMSRARSVDQLNDTYDDDGASISTEERRLPKLEKGRRNNRPTKSESNVPMHQRKDQSRGTSNRGAATKLPKIVPYKAQLTCPDYSMYYTPEDGITGPAKDNQDDKSDVAQLFKIAKQLGKPEDIFTRTLIKKTHKQRMATKVKFRQKYDLDLISELKTGLGPEWEYLIDALLQEKGVADAYSVFDALSGAKKETADMADVVELLCSRDNAGIAELKDCYRKEFSISLEEDMADRTQMPAQTLLLTLQKGVRDESQEADENDARKDAQALADAEGERWESEGGVFMKLLGQRSYPHLQMTFMEYKSATAGQDILNAMKKDCNKDYYKLLSTLVHTIASPAAYHAERLHKHKLPSDPVLVSVLVSRSEIDMPMVKKAYKKLYGVEITEEIKSKPHPTTKCLIELAQKIPAATKKPGDAKKTYVKDGAASQQHQAQQPHSPQTKKTNAQATRKPDAKTKADATDSSVKSEAAAAPSQAKRTTEEKAPQNATSNTSTSTTQAKPEQQPAGNKTKAETSSKVEAGRGTVKPYGNFNADDDCEKLNSAMTDGGTDKVVLAIIPKRSNKQRQQLKATYEQKFRKNLMIDLEEHLTGDMDEMVLALMTPSIEYDAYVLHEAVEGLGAAEATMIAILATRPAKEMKEIKEHYHKAYKSDMEKEITRDCGADFRALLTALTCGRRQPGTSVNLDKAKQDAKLLHQTGVPGEAYEELIVTQNHCQVKATLDEYKKVAGEDIYSALTKAGLGNDEEGYISITKAVEDPVQFYAEKIHSCFTKMGTNDNMLIRLTVSRSEVDLEDIKMRYTDLHGRSLYDAVSSQCRADYKNMLLAVIDNGGDSKPPKKQVQIAPTSKKPAATNQPVEKVMGATVKPAKPFNPIMDCERLHEALSGFGTDEAVIVEILPYRTNDQRQEIKAKYEDKYSKKLQAALENELRGDFEEIVLAMLMRPVEYDAYCLHDAMAGLGTNETVLIAILSTRTGKELSAIKNKYKEVYGTELKRDIVMDVSRGMEDMFEEILKCERPQGDTVDLQQAKDDAYRLYKEGQISIDPTDDVFKDILARKSRAQVRATFKEYKKLTGNDIYYGITKALIGDDEDAYIGHAKAVEDPVLFYTEALHGCFEGVGSNDKRLIRVVVSRSEIDLADIKAMYSKKYGKSLAQSVQDECSGDYKNMLLAIIGK